MERCILFFIIISLFFSCSKENVVQELHLYNGVEEIINVSENSIAFLCNLQAYNKISSLCFIDTSGELLSVYPIDKYLNVDVSSDFIKLVMINKKLLLIYEARGRDIVLECFLGTTSYHKAFYQRDDKSYGSIFMFEDSLEAIYLKSSLIYNSKLHRGYKYNYFILDRDFNTVESGLVDLGEFHPFKITIFNNDIYFIANRTLYKKSTKDEKEQSVYNFNEDIIDLKVIGELLIVLLKDAIYIVDHSGQVVKEFTLNQDTPGYIADSVLDSGDDSIIISLKSQVNCIYKVFSLYGSQTDQFFLEEAIVGDSFIYENDILLYSTGSSLKLKDL